MTKHKYTIKKNRVKELLDGRTQLWLVAQLANTKKPLKANTIHKIVTNIKNLDKNEIKGLRRVFGVAESELYIKNK
jgi:hypothetical protein